MTREAERSGLLKDGSSFSLYSKNNGDFFIYIIENIWEDEFNWIGIRVYKTRKSLSSIPTKIESAVLIPKTN